MTDCNGVKTPLAPKINGKPDAYQDKLDDSINYRRAVGLLNYLVQCTQPDLAFTSSFLSQFLLSPTRKAVAGFRHCLQYLKYTSSTSLLLGMGAPQIITWAEADWGGSIDGRSFLGNQVQFLGVAPNNPSPVCPQLRWNIAHVLNLVKISCGFLHFSAKLSTALV
jgi:hypothetical protein